MIWKILICAILYIVIAYLVKYIAFSIWFKGETGLWPKQSDHVYNYWSKLNDFGMYAVFWPISICIWFVKGICLGIAFIFNSLGEKIFFGR